MQKSDRIRLQHMLDAARQAQMFVAGKTRDDLQADRMLQLSLIKSIEIIGEAAHHVSDARQRALPSIPWRDIIGMRNRLIHAYYDVNIDFIWSTIIEDLPPLIATLERNLEKD